MWNWTLPPMGTLGLLLVTYLIASLMNHIFGEPLKRIMGGVMDWCLKPFRWLKTKAYRKFAPRVPFTWYIRNYKKHVARSGLTRIENPVGPNLDVPLENAFAPLKLISSSTEDSIDLFAHTATSHRCIVLGGPGTGKTTLMKSLVTSVISQGAHPDLNGLIPVFVVLRKLASKQQSVIKAIVDAFEDYHCPGSENFVESALSQGKMLIILDGLDEVSASRQFVVEKIIEFCEGDNQRESRNRVIVTCREHSYRTRDLQSVLPEIVRVEPFANHHMRIFLQGWPVHKGRVAIKLYGLIQNDPQIRDICRNPLLLTILTGLYLDSDNFQLPTSRDKFYKAAIDELLVQRPGRRNIKQIFQDEDKRQVLERVCLNRLENTLLHEDPEEFHRDAIREQAEKILPKNSDVREFISELVEVNGIIKPVTDGVYTCSHRTIQEYFAAREARRTRTHIEVVNIFGSRQELAEVLHFYCGIINNIPQLNEIARRFVSQEKWVEAGRCLLHMTEVIDSSIIKKISNELFNQIQPDIDFKIALEILSSLAQRSSSEFDPTRKLFSGAVDLLAEWKNVGGASALEAVLSASPDAAMKVIPGLLRHESQRWQIAGIKLLRDIGTDEALDQLVQILDHDSSVVRSEAGRILADMIKSRGQDLRPRAALLPDIKSSIVWPYEKYFPGNLALLIATAVANSEDTTNQAINFAAKAVRISNAQLEDQEFFKRWNRLPMILKCQDLGNRCLRYFRITLTTTSVVLLGLIALISFWGWLNKKAIMVEPKSMHWFLIDQSKLADISNQAKAITQHIENYYPPNASGISRILPRNWIVEPIIPENTEEAFNWVKAISGNIADGRKLIIEPSMFNYLTALSSKDQSDLLKDKLASLDPFPDLRGKYHFFFRCSGLDLMAPLLLILMSITFWWLSEKRRRESLDPSRDLLSSFGFVSWSFSYKGPYDKYILLTIATLLLITVFGDAMRASSNSFFNYLLNKPLLSFCKEKIQRVIWLNEPLILAINDLRS